MEASQGTRRPPTATPPCRETSDSRYTNEKTAQKVRTPLRPHRKPPRACGGSQQRHSSSGLPSRSHQTNCKGSHVDNPGVRKGPKRGFQRPPSKDYEQGWVQGFEGTLETGGAHGSGWKLPVRQIGANENIHKKHIDTRRNHASKKQYSTRGLRGDIFGQAGIPRGKVNLWNRPRTIQKDAHSRGRKALWHRVHEALQDMARRVSTTAHQPFSAGEPQCTKPLALRRRCNATTTSPELDHRTSTKGWRGSSLKQSTLRGCYRRCWPSWIATTPTTPFSTSWRTLSQT